MSSLKPTKKVTAAATTGTLAALVIAIASVAGLDVPLEYAALIETGVLWAVAGGFAKREGTPNGQG